MREDEPREGDTTKCDGCEDLFEMEDLNLHSDGNWYCEGCFYPTEQDRIDDEGDRLYHEMRDDGEL